MTQPHLLRLRDTSLCLPVEADLGKQLHDRAGNPVGQVLDFLIEERTVEEAVEAGDRSDSWGARPVYAVVRVRQKPLCPARLVYLPVSCLWDAGGRLRIPAAAQTLTRALKQTRFREFWDAQIGREPCS